MISPIFLCLQHFLKFCSKEFITGIVRIVPSSLSVRLQTGGYLLKIQEIFVIDRITLYCKKNSTLIKLTSARVLLEQLLHVELLQLHNSGTSICEGWAEVGMFRSREDVLSTWCHLRWRENVLEFGHRYYGSACETGDVSSMVFTHYRPK